MLLIFIYLPKAEAADLVLPSKILGILASGRPVVASSRGSELASIADQAGVCGLLGIHMLLLCIAFIDQLISKRQEAGRRARPGGAKIRDGISPESL